ncbi:hypothetical protein AMECASPLE_022998, partial [Ameca splendens]
NFPVREWAVTLYAVSASPEETIFLSPLAHCTQADHLDSLRPSQVPPKWSTRTIPQQSSGTTAHDGINCMRWARAGPTICRGKELFSVEAWTSFRWKQIA